MLKIKLSEKANKKIRILQKFENEIAAYLIGNLDKNNEIYIEDLLIPRQEVSKASVTISPQADVELVKEHGEITDRIIGHLHSHNTMGTFWSTTDEDDIKRIMADRDFFVWMVINDEGIKSRVEMRKPFNFSIQDNIIVQVEVDDSEVKAEFEKQIAEKVSEHVYTYSGCGVFGGWSRKHEKQEAKQKFDIQFFKKRMKLWIKCPDGFTLTVHDIVTQIFGKIIDYDVRSAKRGTEIEIPVETEGQADRLTEALNDSYAEWEYQSTRSGDKIEDKIMVGKDDYTSDYDRFEGWELKNGEWIYVGEKDDYHRFDSMVF